VNAVPPWWIYLSETLTTETQSTLRRYREKELFIFPTDSERPS
jgi:hypothetical protein